MPFYTRLFVKTSLVYAVLAVGLLALTDLASLLRWNNFSPYQTALHLFLVGWVLQLIIGIAYWMFPKYTRERPRGYDGLMALSYGALNLGLVLRLAVEPVPTFWVAPWARTVFAISSVAQWLGLLAFVVNMSLRIKVK